jgi:hypothetical protein
MTSGLLLSQLFRKSDGETANVADIKMSLSKSLVIQAKKVIIVALGLDSLEDDFLVYILCLLNPEHDHYITTIPICQILSRKLFSVPESEFGACWNLVTGQLQDELRGDHPNHRQ